MPDNSPKEPGPFTKAESDPSEILPDWCYEPFVPRTPDPE